MEEYLKNLGGHLRKRSSCRQGKGFGAPLREKLEATQAPYMCGTPRCGARFENNRRVRCLLCGDLAVPQPRARYSSPVRKNDPQILGEEGALTNGRNGRKTVVANHILELDPCRDRLNHDVLLGGAGTGRQSHGNRGRPKL